MIWPRQPENLSFFCTFPIMIQFSEKSLTCLKQVSFIKKPPISNAEIFPKRHFDLNQIYKILLSQNHSILIFNANELLSVFLSLDKSFEVMENV